MQHRPWAVIAVAVVLLLVPGTSAFGAPPSAGSWSVQHGPRSGANVSSGGATWNTSARTVTVTVVAYGLASGACQTSYFDWTSPAKHHDLRGARTCRSGYSARHTWSETVPVTGVHKLRVCTGPKDQVGSCTVHPQASGGVLANWSGSRGRTCVSWVLVAASGAVSVNSGGDPRRCDA